MERPLRRLTASCFATLGSTPFYLLSISSSVQTRQPSLFTSRPASTSSRLVGNGLRSIDTGMSLGGGQFASGGEKASANELFETSLLLVRVAVYCLAVSMLKSSGALASSPSVIS